MSWTAELRRKAEASTKRLIESRSRARTLRDRSIPPMTMVSSKRPTTVYYLAPCETAPSGGVRVIYRHVDLLNELGIPAAVLHDRPGFRSTWFENDTRIVATGDVELHPDDILVVPEFYGVGLHGVPRGVRVIVFNQGAYHTFDHVDRSTTAPGAPYADVKNLIGILTVSADSERLLGYAFPHIPIMRARPVVDGDLFHPGLQPGRRQLAFMRSRRPAEREQLLHLLRARGIDWPLTPISGRSEAEVAEVLRGSAIFLSFSERDGFGLPPAEAMASGCFVVGFTGGGGDEFFDPEYCAPVRTIVEFAQEVERAVARPVDDLRQRGLVASESILARYNVDGLRDDLKGVYAPLIVR
jgi:hypothetical protein